ncbi:MAG TPA: SpoIVB peptidase S55 domain-containing protein [Armatimonadota bacterium]|nr:SpoIVB peptidase S55 domain-containing protein [Armatimonadota bacterium]
MKRLSWLLCLCFCLLGACSTLASAQLAWDPKEMMGLDEIFPGMTGYGKTVFEGTAVEQFDIEVIGVLKKIDFGFDMILIKVTSGPVVQRKLQTVSGMSGSPIYLDDRLIGAYAYGWNFQQEAIAGVTPIAAMLESTQPGAVNPPLVGSLAPRGRVLALGDRLITRVKVAGTAGDAAALQANADPTTLVLAPVSAPVLASGFSDAALKPLRQLLAHYNLRAEMGPGAVDGPAPPLEPGSAVAVSLMEGDANMSAVGTVTYVKGDTVLAFGHPFFGIGKSDMPMSAAYVHGIVNSGQSSFKLASPMGRVGTMVSDRRFAVGGKLGQQPTMFPVNLFLSHPERKLDRRYAVEMIHNPNFTPFMLYAWVLYSGSTEMGDLFSDEGTFTARTVIGTDSLGDIEQHMIVSPLVNTSFLPMGDFYLLADLLMQNPYEPVKLTKVTIDMRYSPERSFAIIEKITPDRLVAHPGDKVNLAVRIRPYGKPVELQQVTVTVPDYVSDPAMAVLVAGGAHGMQLKSLLEPMPTPEEGVKGLVRWFTRIPSAKNLITTQLFPSPSYGYRGRMLRDLPLPLLDLMQLNDMTGAVPTGGQKSESDGDGETIAGGAHTRPTSYLFTREEPFVLLGGQVALIKIETEDAAMSSQGDRFRFGFDVPVLSASQTSGARAGSESAEENAVYSPWLTTRQQLHRQILRAHLPVVPSTLAKPVWPLLRYPAFGQSLPLSFHLGATPRARQDVDATAAPADGADDEMEDEDMGEDAALEDEDDDEDGSSTDPDDVLLTAKRHSWGLTGRADFLRGKHLGTGVTSKGTLALVPAVRSALQTTDIIPWKMVTTARGTYVVGWNSHKVLRLNGGNAAETVFPQSARDARFIDAITAVAARKDGNLLIGVWPSQRVLEITPDGAVTHEWSLPGTMIWALAETTNGVAYAGCDAGGLYILHHRAETPVQVAGTVPDKHVYTLAAGTKGELYVGTYPRGKLYRMKADGYLESIFETRGAVTAVTVDKAGNVYAGTSPTCRVIRISPDGTQAEVMRGLGRGNRHVLALQMLGDDLYAATGPAGGIYRITKPQTQDAEVTAVFAREDLRNGAEEGNGNTGPESLMVNALAPAADGGLLAATSSPGQVLKLEPRTQGAFLSSVLQTPAVARWGQLDIHITTRNEQTVVVESRSGNTAIPDGTWGPWKPLSADGAELTNAPATFAQFRVRMTGTAASSPVLEYARLFYQPVNQAPRIRLESPKPGDFWKGMKDIRWDARDPDDDKLVYMVFISKDDGQTWNQLSRTLDASEPAAAVRPKPGERAKPNGNAKGGEAPKPKVQTEVEEKRISWDSRSVPDGPYRVKIVASDKYARPTDAKSAEIISGRFVVDNTLPSIALDDKVYGWEKMKRIAVTDNLTPLIGGRFKIDDGPWIALVAEDGMFNSKAEFALLVSPDGEIDLLAGTHKVTIQVKDSADNLLDKTYTVVIGEKPPQPVARITVPASDGNDKNLADLMLWSLEEKQ